jgi:Bifunctional DNA primase/polymerase, N-terminal
VFPVEPGGKRPAVDRWEQRATTDLEVIERAWSGQWTGCNVGAPPGRARLLVLDLDCHAELPADWRAIPGVVDGADVFTCLLEWAGESRWPATTWVRTPSGGHHLYFRQPPGQPLVRNSAGLLGPGIDIRGAGGYVLCPGSVVGGRVYELLDGAPPSPCPAWLARRLAPQPSSRPASGRTAPASGGEGTLARVLQVVGEGQPGDRNGRLYWAACRAGELVIAGQIGAGDAEEALVRAAVGVGLRGGEREARATVRSGLRAGGAR